MQDKVRQNLTLLMEYITQKGFVSVQQLMDDHHLSKSTANRYLNALEEEGKIQRRYGSVIAVTSEPAYIMNMGDSPYFLEQSRIGHYAATLIEDRDVVFVGTGKTCFELYRNLNAQELTVFTNSALCAVYRNREVQTLHMLGGEVLDDGVVLGSMGIANLSQINPDKIFFSAAAMSSRYEIQYRYDVERQYIETLMSMRGKKYLLLDSSKLDKQSPFYLDCLRYVQTLIVDNGIKPTAREDIQALGVEVIVV